MNNIIESDYELSVSKRLLYFLVFNSGRKKPFYRWATYRLKESWDKAVMGGA